MDYNLKEIYDCFVTSGTFLSGEPYGSGHIHDTFRIVTRENDKDDYILQRLNNKIFKNISELQHNIERVTIHLRNKLREIPGSDIKRECLSLIPSHKGTSWITDKQGNYWRMYIFISKHKSYNIVDSPDKAYEGGKAIGRFQAMLSDMPGGQLFETIPWFHNIEKRLQALNDKIAENPAGRVGSVENEIKQVIQRAEEMKIILKLGSENKIPLRITHNDTKFNNILLDENDKALCVIDLDTECRDMYTMISVMLSELLPIQPLKMNRISQKSIWILPVLKHIQRVIYPKLVILLIMWRRNTWLLHPD
jgi:hypothetical protein